MPERTPKQIAASHRRRLKTMARKLNEMAVEWNEVDQMNMEVLEVAGDMLEETERKLYDEGEDA